MVGFCRGGSSPKLKGAICRVVAKNVVKSKRGEGWQKFLCLYSEKIIWFFQLNNALIHMFPTFRTKHEKKVHSGQDKRCPSCQKWCAKLSFHHEGGAVAPTASPYIRHWGFRRVFSRVFGWVLLGFLVGFS